VEGAENRKGGQKKRDEGWRGRRKQRRQKEYLWERKSMHAELLRAREFAIVCINCVSVCV